MFSSKSDIMTYEGVNRYKLCIIRPMAYGSFKLTTQLSKNMDKCIYIYMYLYTYICTYTSIWRYIYMGHMLYIYTPYSDSGVI